MCVCVCVFIYRVDVGAPGVNRPKVHCFIELLYKSDIDLYEDTWREHAVQEKYLQNHYFRE